MTPGKVSRRVVVDRLAWVERLVAEIRSLPLHDAEAYFADTRNGLAAESCLRRSLECVLDLGRHILARAYGEGVSEYKEIARGLRRHGVLGPAEADMLRAMAGYRNRLVHFYHEVDEHELRQIAATRTVDLERIADAYRTWVRKHPDRVEETG